MLSTSSQPTIVIPPAGTVTDSRSDSAPPPLRLDDPKVRQESERLWKELDRLAVNDPEKYRQYIQQQLSDYQTSAASFNSVTPVPTIRPGFSVKCKAAYYNFTQPSEVHEIAENQFINFCESNRIEAPDQSALRGHMTGTIPMLLDDPRQRVDRTGQPYVVYDIFCHPSVIETAMQRSTEFQARLIQLAQHSISTTFPPLVLKKAYKINKSRYKGPFQWDLDGEKLKGLPTADLEALAKDRSKPTDAMLSNILKSLDPTAATANTKAENQCNQRDRIINNNILPPLDALKSINTTTATTAAGQQTKLIVEEQQQQSSSSKLKPLHELERLADGSMVVLRVHLPRETSSAEFELSTSAVDLRLETPLYRLQLDLESDMNAPIQAQFAVDARILTVRLLQPPLNVINNNNNNNSSKEE